jgi:hypothetical protein
MNSTLPTEITPKGAIIVDWLENPGQTHLGFTGVHVHRFLVTAAEIRKKIPSSCREQADQAASHLLLECGVRGDNADGLALLTAAALTSSMQLTPSQEWMAEIRNGFGSTVARLIEAVTARENYKPAQIPSAVLAMQGRHGALAQALRTAHVAARTSRQLLMLQQVNLPLHCPTLGPALADVEAEIAFQEAVPQDTTTFSVGFNSLFWMARQLNLELRDQVALDPDP